MADPSLAPGVDRCPHHDFPLDAAGCALCRQEAAGRADRGGVASPRSAILPRRRLDPAVTIVGGALTFAGCVLPLAAGVFAGLLAWLIFDTGARLTIGIGLAAALLALLGVLQSR